MQVCDGIFSPDDWNVPDTGSVYTVDSLTGEIMVNTSRRLLGETTMRALLGGASGSSAALEASEQVTRFPQPCCVMGEAWILRLDSCSTSLFSSMHVSVSGMQMLNHLASLDRPIALRKFSALQKEIEAVSASVTSCLLCNHSTRQLSCVFRMPLLTYLERQKEHGMTHTRPGRCNATAESRRDGSSASTTRRRGPSSAGPRCTRSTFSSS